jgi:putative phage-type endonuclease
MTTLRVLPDLEQRSPEWYAARCGIVTASMVGKLLTSTLKVADNDYSRGITQTLVAERITGNVEETPVTSDMWRGIEFEPIARDIYAQHNNASVTEVGFMRADGDGWTLGFSPDGLVGDDGLIEIKCPRAKTHLRTILAGEVPAQYMAQCQAGLLVSGRRWLDFVSFVGGMPLFVARVTPDPKWFEAITAACVAFEANAARTITDYQQRTAGMPQTERIDFDLKVA